MKRLRVAVVGFGRLGHACANALLQRHDLDLAGVVRHGTPAALPAPLERTAVSGHLRELGRVDGALLCVPAEQTLGVAREILQQSVPLVECARLEHHALDEHYKALGVAARHHRVVAIVGAGWDPGILPGMRRLFEVLIPHGHTEATADPGITLHHSTLNSIPGVEKALVCDRRAADGHKQHYVYVTLDRGANRATVERAISEDPLYAGEETFVFPCTDLAALEAAGSGVVLQRHGSGGAGPHESALFEARFDIARFAANVMLDAALRLPALDPGAHCYRLGL